MACAPTPTVYRVLPEDDVHCPEEAGVLEFNDDGTYCCTSENASSEKFLRALHNVYAKAQVEDSLPPNLVRVMGWIKNRQQTQQTPPHVDVDVDHATTLDIVKLAIMTRSTATIRNEQRIVYSTDHVRLFSNIVSFTTAINETEGIIQADFFLDQSFSANLVPLVKAKVIEIDGMPETPVNIAELVAAITTGVHPGPLSFKMHRRLVVKTGTSAVSLVVNLVKNLPNNFGRIQTTFASSSQGTNLPDGFVLVQVDEGFCRALGQSLGVKLKFTKSKSVVMQWKHVRVFFNLKEILMVLKVVTPQQGVKRKLSGGGASGQGVKRKLSHGVSHVSPGVSPSLNPTKADFLLKNGYVVIPTQVFADPQRKIDFLTEASRFPEFNPGTSKFVLGGFAALGNPASFHNPVVRKFRQWVHAIAVDEVFRDLTNKFDNPAEWKLDHIIDRMLIRVQGESPSSESWHRDEASGLITGDKKKFDQDRAYFGDEEIDDKIFGGWVNLDQQSQYFSCIRESHLPNSLEHRGFKPLSKSECAEMKKHPKKTRVEIPPGSILVFFENIIHEVLPSKATDTMARLFTAFRLTRFDKTRPSDLRTRIDTQAPVMIKSGQEPAMYPSSAKNFRPEQIERWSLKNIRPELLHTYTPARGKRVNETFRIIRDRVMKGLGHYGFPLYLKYTEDELLMHTPQRTWRLLVPGSDTEYKTYSL